MITNPNKFGRQDTQSEYDIESGRLYDEMLANEMETGFSVAEAGRAAAEEGWITSFGTVGRYALGIDETGDELTPDQVAEQFDGMKVRTNMHYGEALRLSNQRDNRAYADFVMQNVNESSLGSTIVPFLGGLAGNIADPATLALGVTSAIVTAFALPAMPILGAAGSTAVGTFVASSFLEWGVEEALYHNYYEDMFNEEYTAQDSMMNLIAAFTLGGIIEFGSGSLKNIWNKGSPKVKQLLLDYQSGSNASGRRPNLATLEKVHWEDVWNGATSNQKLLGHVDELKNTPIHGVKMIEGPSKGSGDHADMDTNHSKDAIVFTGDEGMANKHASDVGGNKVTAQVKQDARILDLDNPEPGVFEGVAALLPDDGMGGKVYENMTLADIMDFLNTPTQNAEINMKRQKALQAIDDYLIEQGYDGTKKVGGRVHGEKFDGNYQHDAVTIYNKDAIEEIDTGKAPPNNGNRIVDRKIKGEEIYSEMNAPESQKGYNQEMEHDIDEMAMEYEDTPNKAPDNPTPEKLKVFDEAQYKVVGEEGNLVAQMVTDMRARGLDPKLANKIEQKLEGHLNRHKNWSPEEREALEIKRKAYDVCKLGGS